MCFFPIIFFFFHLKIVMRWIRLDVCVCVGAAGGVLSIHHANEHAFHGRMTPLPKTHRQQRPASSLSLNTQCCLVKHGASVIAAASETIRHMAKYQQSDRSTRWNPKSPQYPEPTLLEFQPFYHETQNLFE